MNWRLKAMVTVKVKVIVSKKNEYEVEKCLLFVQRILALTKCKCCTFQVGYLVQLSMVKQQKA
jgi:hypothetical protein